VFKNLNKSSVELIGGGDVMGQVNEAMLDVIRAKNYQVNLSESSDESSLHGKSTSSHSILPYMQLWIACKL
jgi:hypothetical protein